MDAEQKKSEISESVVLEILSGEELGKEFHAITRSIIRCVGKKQDDGVKIGRLDAEVEEEIIDKYQKLTASYIGVPPGSDEDVSFGCMISTCGRNDSGQKLDPVAGFEYIPYWVYEDIFVDPDNELSWIDVDLNGYLDKVKLSETPEIFETNLKDWLLTMFLKYTEEYDRRPHPDARGKMSHVSQFIVRRYSEYRTLLQKLIRELFYMY